MSTHAYPLAEGLGSVQEKPFGPEVSPAVSRPDLREDYLRLSEEYCSGTWRLKQEAVLRAEEDGAILFDPETDALVLLNKPGVCLVRWRPSRISYREWCAALSARYPNVQGSRIQADVRMFLAVIAPFLEKCDERSS